MSQELADSFLKWLELQGFKKVEEKRVLPEEVKEKKDDKLFETKSFKFEIKNLSDETGEFEGYGNVFNIKDDGGDLTRPCAFNQTLKNKDTFPFFYGHDMNQPLGVLKVSTDARGLKVNGVFDLNTQAGREKQSLSKKGAFNGLSIGYKTVKEHYEDKTRVLDEVKLYEVSLVPWPMNQESYITSMKSDEVMSYIINKKQDKDFINTIKGVLETEPAQEPACKPFKEMLEESLQKLNGGK